MLSCHIGAFTAAQQVMLLFSEDSKLNQVVSDKAIKVCENIPSIGGLITKL